MFIQELLHMQPQSGHTGPWKAVLTTDYSHTVMLANLFMGLLVGLVPMLMEWPPSLSSTCRGCVHVKQRVNLRHQQGLPVLTVYWSRKSWLLLE